MGIGHFLLRVGYVDWKMDCGLVEPTLVCIPFDSQVWVAHSIKNVQIKNLPHVQFQSSVGRSRFQDSKFTVFI